MLKPAPGTTAIYALFNAAEEVLNHGPGCEGVCPRNCRHVQAFGELSRCLERAATVAP